MFWFLFLAQMACTTDKTSVEEDEYVQGRVSLYPPAGGLGTELEVAFEANRSTFAFSNTDIDFGEGILVNAVQVDDGWHACQ